MRRLKNGEIDRFKDRAPNCIQFADLCRSVRIYDRHVPRLGEGPARDWRDIEIERRSRIIRGHDDWSVIKSAAMESENPLKLVDGWIKEIGFFNDHTEQEPSR